MTALETTGICQGAANNPTLLGMPPESVFVFWLVNVPSRTPFSRRLVADSAEAQRKTPMGEGLICEAQLLSEALPRPMKGYKCKPPD